MQRMMSEVLQYYDKEVIRMMIAKYNYSPMDAIRKYIQSQTHMMLEDLQYSMWEFGCPAIFSIWESEAIENSFDDIDQLVIERKLQMERIGKEEHHGRIGENTKGEGKL